MAPVRSAAVRSTSRRSSTASKRADFMRANISGSGVSGAKITEQMLLVNGDGAALALAATASAASQSLRVRSTADSIYRTRAILRDEEMLKRLLAVAAVLIPVSYTHLTLPTIYSV